MIEGESGLLACAPPWFTPSIEPALGVVHLAERLPGFTYSSEVPDKLRGPQHHKFWGDELCKWKHAQDTWDNLQFGLRLGDNPQGVITTTPRPIPTLKEILADPATVITRGSTFDNKHNLPKRFLDRLLRLYAGTRLGRQELNAELLTDTPGALWTLKIIEACRVRRRRRSCASAIAIDPPRAAREAAAAEDSRATRRPASSPAASRPTAAVRLHDVSGQLTPANGASAPSCSTRSCRPTSSSPRRTTAARW
jgi:phage terminase large subunit-like protein